MKIFIASPLGFALSTRPFIKTLSTILSGLSYDVIDPWSLSGDLEQGFEAARRIDSHQARAKLEHSISMKIARRNAEHLAASDGVLAVLDGVDVDSGTASEIGYAFGLGGKVIHGIRTDFRMSGENLGVAVNLQVHYWIEASGGSVLHSLDELPTISFDPIQRRANP